MSTPRPTPETDAEFPSLRHRPDETALWVSIGRLRDLERQRDEARDRLRALEWRPTAESLPTEDDASEYGDVEWADQHDIWQGNYQDHSHATHWRPITLPNPQ